MLEKEGKCTSKLPQYADFLASIAPFLFKNNLKILFLHGASPQTHPTTNGGTQNGSSVGTCKRCMRVFARFAPICMLSRCLLTKFLHRSSVGSLLRVSCCWLGREIRRLCCRNLLCTEGGGGKGGKRRERVVDDALSRKVGNLLGRAE